MEKIEDIDYYGRGITHIDNKVTFVKNALPDELVDIHLIEHKKYNEGEVIKYYKYSKDRVSSICPYYNLCGGCHILHLEYDKTIEWKLNKVKNYLDKNNIIYNNIDIIPNKNNLYYHNKVSLKIVNGHIGFYKENTHELIEINKCFVADSQINKVILNYRYLNIVNGNLTIRVNPNKEVLLIIESDNNKYNIDIQKLKENIKIVGIVYNNKCIYLNNYLMVRLDGLLFKVSYNSFFQVNYGICRELFKLVEKQITKDSLVLDLYSGVGTLGIVSSRICKRVVSVEIVNNAILNGIENAKLNKCDNIDFLLGSTSSIVNKLKNDFDCLIIDPPRKGIDKETMKFILRTKIPKIIYISCELSTLTRDLKILEKDYKIKFIKVLDMFSYSYHTECFCLLELI